MTDTERAELLNELAHVIAQRDWAIRELARYSGVDEQTARTRYLGTK